MHIFRYYCTIVFTIVTAIIWMIKILISLLKTEQYSEGDYLLEIFDAALGIFTMINFVCTLHFRRIIYKSIYFVVKNRGKNTIDLHFGNHQEIAS